MFFDPSLISTNSTFLYPPASSACPTPKSINTWRARSSQVPQSLSLPACTPLTQSLVPRHTNSSGGRPSSVTFLELCFLFLSIAFRSGKGQLWIRIMVPLLISCVALNELSLGFNICKNWGGFDNLYLCYVPRSINMLKCLVVLCAE